VATGVRGFEPQDLFVPKITARVSGVACSLMTLGSLTRHRLARCAERADDGLGEFLARVLERITAADVAGFDETGLRVDCALHWVRCARADRYTLITCHRSRGRNGMTTLGCRPGARRYRVNACPVRWPQGIPRDVGLYRARRRRRSPGRCCPRST